MNYLYELYPAEINLTSPVITLREGLNKLQVSERITVHIRAHNGSILWNGEQKVHNDIVNIHYKGEVFERKRVISIVKRGELNVVESTRLDLCNWENAVKSVWPLHIELPRIGFSHKQNEMYLLKIRWHKNSDMRVGHMIEIKMLALPASSLLWCPFPEMDTIPDMKDLASICMERPFHTVKPVAPKNAISSPVLDVNSKAAAEVKRVEFEVPLSLRTACFEHEYPFSGTIHPKEDRTPASLLNLCRLVEDIFSPIQESPKEFNSKESANKVSSTITCFGNLNFLLKKNRAHFCANKQINLIRNSADLNLVCDMRTISVCTQAHKSERKGTKLRLVPS